jgi:general secretion pathway protein D/type IV pilus assembly protein PilQ
MIAVRKLNAIQFIQAVIMTKLHRVLLLCLAVVGLGFGSLGQAQTAASKLPSDARFDTPITIDMPSSGLPLELYLKALAATVKLSVVAEAIPSRIVTYEFNGKPFRQVWELVVALNQLDFLLQPNDVIVVGPPQVISLLRPKAPEVAPPPPPPPAQPPVRERKAYIIKGDLPAIQALLEKEFPQIAVNPLTASRTLVVTATAAQHAEIERLLLTVDVAPPAPPAPPPPPAAAPTVRQVVSLSYARASTLAEALSKISQGTVVSGNAAQTTTAPGGAVIGSQVTIVPVGDSNKLIISGPQDQVQDVVRLIPQLDVKEALVNVGVRIQEITDEAGRSLGIDWSFGFGNFAAKILGGTGLGFVFDATRSLAGLNIGAALNALETQRLSKRINDSTLTVLNNGKASLASGGRIELTQVSGGTGGQLASRTLNYGVRIEVSPQVASDGTINMKVKGEVSALLNPERVDPARIDFRENSSETTLSLKDGETVVLGTLLQTSQDTSTSGVPILSAIPLIGELFKTRRTSDNQTQLMIVMTVNVVK